MADRPASHLRSFRAPTQLKLSALWASLMFCYVYGDYFGLYVPGKLADVAAGRMGFGEVSPTALVLVAVMMAIPAVMVALSLLLPAVPARASNIILGVAYAAIMLLTMSGGAPPFYLVLGVIEVMLSAAIVFYAWSWPHDAGDDNEPV